MKFEYDKEEDRGKVVAFIDADGYLWFRYNAGESIIMTPGNTIMRHELSLEKGMEGQVVHKKFYRGDKITITF